MQSSFCDGLPVKYSHSDPTSEDPRRTCTTQSPDDSGDYPNLEALYTPSPSLDFAETIQPAPTQAVHYPPATDTATQTFPLSPVLPSTDPSQAMWPTPPPTTCEDFEDYTYQASPASTRFGAHNSALSIIPSIESPRSWSSPEAQHYAYSQPVWRSQEPTPPYNMQVNLAVPNEELYHHQQMQIPHYAHPGFHPNTMESDAITDVAGGSDRSLSPVSNHDPSGVYSFGDDDTGPLPVQGVDGDEDGGSDEPYAQLIFRALMSRPSHSMTLQEIYQWFRDETNKAKGDSKGWQNSIRHNLSMNQAFVKRDKKPAAGDPVTEAGEPKKSSEWFLEDWAAEGGVQSTTRYRTKGTANRRSGSGINRSQSGHQHHLSARASSGRRGGITASRTRAAANRAILRRQQYGEILAPQMPGGTSFPRTHGYYSRQGSLDFTAAHTRIDRVASPEMPVGDMLYGDDMHGAQALGPATGEGYYFVHGQQPHHSPSHGHSIQHHAHQNLTHPQPPNPYRLEDVTSVYEPPVVPHTAANGDPSLLATHVPTAFNNLFTDEMGGENNMTGASMRINLNYGWGDGSQFQS